MFYKAYCILSSTQARGHGMVEEIQRQTNSVFPQPLLYFQWGQLPLGTTKIDLKKKMLIHDGVRLDSAAFFKSWVSCCTRCVRWEGVKEHEELSPPEPRG